MNAVSQNIGQQPIKALRLNRPLMPIEQYAQREGITVDEVEYCGKIGILQLRRKNGNSYVVDIPPLCSYEVTSEIDTEIAELIGAPAQPAPEQPQAEPEPEPEIELEFIPEPDESQDSSIQPQSQTPCQPVKPGSIAELVQKMAQRSEQIKAEAAACNQTLQQSDNTEQQTPLPPVTQKLIELIDAQLDHIESIASR